MPRKRLAHLHRAGSSASSSDGSSDDDDEQPGLDGARYEAAQLSLGLRTRAYRQAAVGELQAIFQQGLYSSADKRVQAAIFNDCQLAAQQRDSRAPMRQSIADLLAAATRVLPQQKRQTLLKAHKQAAVAASRERRGGEPGGSAGGQGQAQEGCDDNEEDENEHDVVVFGDAPLEVVAGILQGLDPCSLAVAACVCRSWYELATSDELWRRNLEALFPSPEQRVQRHAARQQQQHAVSRPSAHVAGPHHHHHHPAAQQALPARQLAGIVPPAGSPLACAAACVADTPYRRFAREAQRRPAALLPWRSCRVLRHGRLVWAPPAGALWPGAGGDAAVQAARLAKQGAVPPGPLYITIEQVICWLLQRPMREVLRPPQLSSGDSSSASSAGNTSDSDDGGSGGADARRVAALKLWAVGPAPC